LQADRARLLARLRKTSALAAADEQEIAAQL
jgi:hypothetical protein